MDSQTRHELKNDQFVTATKSGLEWASENRRSVITTSAIVLVVILVVVGVGVFFNMRSAKAEEAFGNAMQTYQADIAQAGEPVPPGLVTFPTPSARAEAANKQFGQVADTYGMTAAGKNARFFQGVTFIEEGQNASAESTLKKVADGWDKDLASLANLSLAALYHQTSRDAQAIDIYNKLIAKPTRVVPAPTAQLALAELYDSAGKTADARRIYAVVKDKESKTAAGQIADQHLNPGQQQPQF